MRALIDPWWTLLRAQWERLRSHSDAGYSTETVLVTALLVLGALTVIAIVIAKVTEKASGITL
ncbi:hypothetical protein [Saccharothrix sp.]|uniref:hypothetical protein n=1 Tax=Saccharothrix sp. TaxID=1873460 RepID=UPI002811D2E3|nr:hypothetical protein [Saccharothrix sp.]